MRNALLWAKDRFRRRVTEKPSLAGYPSKKVVVIGPVRRVEGKEAFEADFVSPRLFSQLAPFRDHHTAYSLDMASYQIANAAIRKFEGKTKTIMPIVDYSVKWRKFPSRETKLLIQISPTKTDKTFSGTELRYFRARVIDKNNPKTIFANGEFSISILQEK